MRSLQLTLLGLCDFLDDSVSVIWAPSNAQDLFWCSDVQNLLAGISLEVCLRNLLFWSDASDFGWGANLVDQFAPDLWSLEERDMSIDWRGRRALHLGMFHFRESLRGKSVGLFSDNMMALAYLKKQGGTFSKPLNGKEKLLLLWTESMGITLLPQFIMGAKNVVADSLNHRYQVLGSEWTLAQEVVDELRRMWSAIVDLFATSLNFCLPVYFSHLNDPMAAGTDAFLQDWNGLQAYAFPRFALIRQVRTKLWSCKATELTDCPVLDSERVVSGFSESQ